MAKKKGKASSAKEAAPAAEPDIPVPAIADEPEAAEPAETGSPNKQAKKSKKKRQRDDEVGLKTPDPVCLTSSLRRPY